MMQLLFGQTASVQATGDGAALTRVVVQHECGVKATFPSGGAGRTGRDHDA